MATKAEFKKSLELLSPKVTRYMKPVTKDEIPTKTLYHVSTNDSIPVFIPQVSSRTTDNEDVRVPRICVAADLISCLVGYGAMWRDYYDDKSKGDWTIYEFDFEFAVLPSEKLLPDQKRTNEYWLITHSKETREFKPKKIGSLKLVGYSSMSLRKDWQYVLGFIVDSKVPVWINEETELPAGQHFFSVEGWRSIVDYEKLKFTHRPLDPETYEKLLAGRINFLPQLAPGSSQW